MNHWIVVANAKRARVLEEPSAEAAVAAPHYVHVAEVTHPGRRTRGAGGRSGGTRGAASGPAGSSGGAPLGHEDDQFAREVARLLDQGVADGRCAGLVLIASHPVLGLLKARLGAQASKAVRRSLVADFTTLDEATLRTRLAQTQGRALATGPFFAVPLGAVTRG